MGSGVPVANKWLISTAYAVSCVALLGLTGCGGSAPDDGYGGPAPSSYEDSRGSGELMGGKAPPPPPSDGLAGGPAVGGMATIPNPENLPLEERRRIYGNKYDHLKYRPLPGAGDYAQAQPAKGENRGKAPASALRSYRNAEGIWVVHNDPIANPEDMSPAERRRIYGKRYAPRPQSSPSRGWTAWKPKHKAKAAPRVAAAPAYKAPPPKVVAARPAPKVAMAPAPKPVVKPAPAPVKVAPPVAVAKATPAPAPVIKPTALPPVAKAPAAAPAKPVDPKMAALTTAVSAEAIKGATLTVPETLAKGEESKVTLALPVTLLDLIQSEAAKLGLTKAARKAEVSATLTGDGYTITPNAAQTQALKKGEAATFNWQVKPADGEKTPLKATVDGALKGQKGAPKTFSIATLEQVVANAIETGESQAKKLGFNLDKLAIPGLKPINIGGTVIPPGATTAAIIAFIIGLILLAMARAGAGRRAREERRRKFRTMTDYGRAEPEATPEKDHHTVNPMLAAAGGAAAGAAAMSFASSDHDHHQAPAHDDHAHAQAEAHAHDTHAEPAHSEPAHGGHADHGHAEPAHADHGHVDPAHAEASHHDDQHVHAPEHHPVSNPPMTFHSDATASREPEHA